MSYCYHWQGPEEHLSYNYFVSEFAIQQFQGDNMPFEASGIIVGRDYIEHGIRSEKKWTARLQSAKSSSESQWAVSPAEDDCFVFARCGVPCFTLSDEIDDGLLAFIAKHLRLHQAGHDPTLPEFKGEKHTYTGPCLCATAEKSLKNWRQLTNDGQFPERCFQCSCGNRLYQCTIGSTTTWMPVPDGAGPGKCCSSITAWLATRCLSEQNHQKPTPPASIASARSLALRDS